jgi:hypothetical protein
MTAGKSVHNVLKKLSCLNGYKLQFLHAFHKGDNRIWRDFPADLAYEHFLLKTPFCDEANFHIPVHVY